MISDISGSLLKYYRNDVLLVGPEGIGKSALLKEFVRRVITNMKAYYALYGVEIFQLSEFTYDWCCCPPAVSTENFIPIGMASKTSQSDSSDQPNG